MAIPFCAKIVFIHLKYKTIVECIANPTQSRDKFGLMGVRGSQSAHEDRKHPTLTALQTMQYMAKALNVPQ